MRVMAGKPSFENINYTLRPRKCVERKMFCEAFLRLSKFQAVQDYRYIGLGSPYFSDFALFHRILNFAGMDSIEREVEYQARFDFNVPYKCITMHYGETGEILSGSEIDWDAGPHIVWLDYDDPLVLSMLHDVQTVCTNALPGSFLIVSTNAHPGKDDGHRLERLTENVSAEKIPVGLKEKDLAGSNTARTYRRLIHTEIVETLQTRNGGQEDQQHLTYSQVINFHYQDQAPMMTVGGVIYRQAQQETFDSCEFHRLQFYRNEAEEYRIDVPNLTFREIRELDKQLPDAEHLPTLGGVSEEDIQKYREIYRYFPTFAEADF